eukprot:scaffold56840_cov18-Tisochrysis_lutea.AAC.1
MQLTLWQRPGDASVMHMANLTMYFTLCISLPFHRTMQFTLWQRAGDTSVKNGYGQEGMSLVYEVISAWHVFFFGTTKCKERHAQCEEWLWAGGHAPRVQGDLSLAFFFLHIKRKTWSALELCNCRAAAVPLSCRQEVWAAWGARRPALTWASMATFRGGGCECR